MVKKVNRLVVINKNQISKTIIAMSTRHIQKLMRRRTDTKKGLFLPWELFLAMVLLCHDQQVKDLPREVFTLSI